MSEATNPLPPMPRPKDALADYKTACMRGNFYSYQREAAKSAEKAEAFGNASDAQSELQAKFMDVITHNKAYDLADVHAKLTLLEDLFGRYFEQPDFVVQDQAKLLRDSIEWIKTFLAFEHEKKPVSAAKKKAA